LKTSEAVSYPSLGEVHLWYVNLIDWNNHLEDLIGLLSSDELKRYKRLKISSKQESFIISRGVLRLILSNYLEQEASQIRFEIEPSGKPFLPDSEITFNLSHSGKYVVVGICQGSYLGVDIQEIYPISASDQIIRKVFSEKEQIYLSTLPPERFLEEFFSLWTAREAYLKAIGKGFTDSSNTQTLLPDPNREGYFTLSTIDPQINSSDWTIQTIAFREGYQTSVAFHGNLKELKISQFLEK
jgi:4'-phosphopantetheinyl transferase